MTSTHGRWKSPTYNSWSTMKDRCLNPKAKNYPLYGGRGVTIWPGWLSFERFLADMGERRVGKTLDRQDPHGDYEPGNCRWATKAEQTANRRKGELKLDKPRWKKPGILREVF